MPRVLQALVRRLVRWGVLPAAKAPDSAIINIYEPEDCIPPHIDHHDFTRPFCTLRWAAQLVLGLGSGSDLLLPAAKAPDSAIINIYEPEGCIPPHIDHYDFTRPFCTLRWAAAQLVPGLGSGLDLLLPAAKTPAAPSSVSMSRRVASRRTSTTTTSSTPSARSGARPGTRGP